MDLVPIQWGGDGHESEGGRLIKVNQVGAIGLNHLGTI